MPLVKNCRHNHKKHSNRSQCDPLAAVSSAAIDTTSVSQLRFRPTLTRSITQSGHLKITNSASPIIASIKKSKTYRMTRRLEGVESRVISYIHRVRHNFRIIDARRAGDAIGVVGKNTPPPEINNLARFLLPLIKFIPAWVMRSVTGRDRWKMR